MTLQINMNARLAGLAHNLRAFTQVLGHLYQLLAHAQNGDGVLYNITPDGLATS